jgi:hypothetical protein
MKDSEQSIEKNTVSKGNVYVMTHSFFSDVIRIGCTPEDPQKYANKLSANSPGQYTLVFFQACDNPCQVKKQIRDYLDAQKYVNEFYEVPPQVAEKLLKQESLRIPTLLAM